MTIHQHLLRKHDHTRSGIRLPIVRGVVFHYPQAQGWRVMDLINYLNDLPVLEPDKYASYNYAIDINGDTYMLIPEEECAWASGPSKDTKPDIEQLLGGKPNWRTISICMMHPKGTDHFTIETLESAQELAADILRRHGADIILRHYDCTGKNCPAWFVSHPSDWREFTEEILIMV